MKNTTLSLRLPDQLSSALTAYAAHRGVPRSTVIRAALSAYIADPSAHRAAAVTGAELARRWVQLPVLDAHERDTFAADISTARAALPPLDAP